MIEKKVYILLIIILVPEKVFQLIGFFFLCGYSFGYYMIDYLRYKNKKKEIEDFFKNYNGSECRSTFRKDARNEFD